MPNRHVHVLERKVDRERRITLRLATGVGGGIVFKIVGDTNATALVSL